MPKIFLKITIYASLLLACVMPSAVAQTGADDSATGRTDTAKAPSAYEYREKGLRALGDGAYSTAANFFSIYRDKTEFREPQFADATALLIQANLRRDAIADAAAAAQLHQEKSAGVSDEFYAQTLNCWLNALNIRQGKAGQAVVNLQKIAGATGFPEVSTLANNLLGQALVKQARWNEAEQAFNQTLASSTLDDDDETQIRLALVRVKVAKEEYAVAREVLAKLAGEKKISESTVKLYEILIATAAGEIQTALEEFKALEQSTPTTYDEHWWIVLSHLTAKLMALEKWETAIPVIRAAVKMVPNQSEYANLKIQLAEIFRKADKPEQALQVLTELKKERPDTERTIEIELQMAQLNRKLNRLEQAAELFKGVAQNPEVSDDVRIRAALSAGWCLHDLNDFKQATGAFAYAAKIAPTADQKAIACLFAGAAATKDGDLPTAVELYQRVGRDFASTQVAPTAKLRLARVLMKQAAFDAAVGEYRDFLDKYPGDERIAAAKFELGLGLNQGGNSKDAIKTLAEFVKQYSTNENAPQALLEIYRIHREQGDFKAALESLTKLCSSYPNSELYATALYHRIYVAFLIGDDDLAITEAEKFIRDYPKLPMSADVMLWLGDHYAALANYDKAIEFYLNVSTSHPKLKQADMALFSAANCLTKTGKYERAANLLQAMLEKVPDEDALDETYAKAALMLADVFAEKTDFAAARENYTKAAGLATQDSDIYAHAKMRAADMMFTIGDEENLKNAENVYRELLKSVNAAENNEKLVENLKFRLARTLEALKKNNDALTLYLEVVFDYDMDVAENKVRDWFYFVRSAEHAARILLLQENFDAAARVYERIAESGVPYAPEAAQRARQIRESHEIID